MTAILKQKNDRLRIVEDERLKSNLKNLRKSGALVGLSPEAVREKLNKSQELLAEEAKLKDDTNKMRKDRDNIEKEIKILTINSQIATNARQLEPVVNDLNVTKQNIIASLAELKKIENNQTPGYQSSPAFTSDRNALNIALMDLTKKQANLQNEQSELSFTKQSLEIVQAKNNYVKERDVKMEPYISKVTKAQAEYNALKQDKNTPPEVLKAKQEEYDALTQDKNTPPEVLKAKQEELEKFTKEKDEIENNFNLDIEKKLQPLNGNLASELYKVNKAKSWVDYFNTRNLQPDEIYQNLFKKMSPTDDTTFNTISAIPRFSLNQIPDLTGFAPGYIEPASAPSSAPAPAPGPVPASSGLEPGSASSESSVPKRPRIATPTPPPPPASSIAASTYGNSKAESEATYEKIDNEVYIPQYGNSAYRNEGIYAKVENSEYVNKEIINASAKPNPAYGNISTIKQSPGLGATIPPAGVSTYGNISSRNTVVSFDPQNQGNRSVSANSLNEKDIKSGYVTVGPEILTKNSEYEDMSGAPIPYVTSQSNTTTARANSKPQQSSSPAVVSAAPAAITTSIPTAQSKVSQSLAINIPLKNTPQVNKEELKQAYLNKKNPTNEDLQQLQNVLSSYELLTFMQKNQKPKLAANSTYSIAQTVKVSKANNQGYSSGSESESSYARLAPRDNPNLQ